MTGAIEKKYTVKTNATEYAYKIEVSDESTGRSYYIYTKDGPSQNWSNVNIDIQACYSPDQKKFKFAYIYTFVMV